MAEQIADQTLHPDLFLIVDGEGGSPDVDVIARRAAEGAIPVRVVRSTQPNLPFQRYLAWRAARGSRLLVFLDDDLLLPRRDALAQLTAPLREGPLGIAATTAQIRSSAPVRRPFFAGSRFGSSRLAEPGAMTPTGVRIEPDAATRDVAWLRGGAMAFRTDVLSGDCFPHSLFALAGRGWGMGEDLALARRVLRRGRIVLTPEAVFVHPNDEPSQAVPGGECRRGFAAAYSRRLLNDLYRGDQPPLLSDRLALVRGYAGGVAAALRDARPGYAGGYALGALLGCVAPPSPRLAPHINWEREAARSLGEREQAA